VPKRRRVSPLTPARILDTRQTDALDPNETRSLSVTGSVDIQGLVRQLNKAPGG